MIRATRGKVGSNGACYCNMINHNNLLANKGAFILSFLSVVACFPTLTSLLSLIHKMILCASSFLPERSKRLLPFFHVHGGTNMHLSGENTSIIGLNL